MIDNVTAAKVIYFTKENARFYKTKNGFAAMKAFIPPVETLDDDYSLETDEEQKTPDRHGAGFNGPGRRGEKRVSGKKLFDPDGECEWQDVGRVYFHRAFPFDMPDKFISVMDKESNEYGMIKDLDVFDEETKTLINEALDRKYYMPVIQKILELKEQFGYSYWTVLIDKEKREFSVRDTFKSILRISDTKLLILDSDGNRFLIEDLSALDRKSMRKIEVYL